MLRKLLALLLCFSLLGQNALFAAPAPESEQNQPETLVQYQQRAKEDMKRAPWLEREGKYIIGIGGTALALLGAQHLYYHNKINTFKQRVLPRIQKQDADVSHWQTAYGIEKERNQAFLQAAKAREERLIKAMNEMQEQMAQRERAFSHLTYYRNPAALDAQMQKYTELFNPNLTVPEYNVLMKSLKNEPWMAELTEAQRKEFLRIIREANIYAGSMNKESGGRILLDAMRRNIENHIPTYNRVISLAKQVFSPKTLPAVLLLATLGLAAHTANAQDAKIADRINTNFDLFLNATPEELAALEQNEEARKVCIQGAEALHQMSLLPPEEAQKLRESLQGEGRTHNSELNLAR